MPSNTSLQIAIGNHRQVPPDWMPASQVRPFIVGDPAVVWLEYHGAEHGFEPDTSPYAFGDFIAEKGRQFEEKWLQEMAPDAIRVCHSAQDARSADKVRETFELMRRASLASSNGEARRLIKGGGGRLNDVAIGEETAQVTLADINADGVIKLSAGKKRHALVRPA